MKTLKSLLLVNSAILILALTALAQNGSDKQNIQKTVSKPQIFLESLVGSWEGTCRTWFRPGELADESMVTGEFQLMFGGRLISHSYDGKLLGKPRSGEETIAFNTVKNKFQTAWVDEFHMNYGILFSEGDPDKSGFTVEGKYDVGPDQPPWGWKTVFMMTDKDHLTITAYNLSPDGEEAKAIETKYIRKKL